LSPNVETIRGAWLIDDEIVFPRERKVLKEGANIRPPLGRDVNGF